MNMISLNEFVEKFASEFDETPADNFTEETVYKELDEWGSLVALSIISMIDEEFDKFLTGADLRSVSTIRELYDLIQTR
ncbi:acyl carrier protein [Butyricimonas sp. Marseille-P3923]|uniref:acyl carrier protein n=1 Tax=Butyricimonas sp. Marseille-P3923 TaxID=1987504 RepID=UPI00210020DA|nr:acyl carrier protein [Butyricimonas sp. Marseille-P3923]